MAYNVAVSTVGTVGTVGTLTPHRTRFSEFGRSTKVESILILEKLPEDVYMERCTHNNDIRNVKVLIRTAVGNR